jgi:hypothetical protein
MMWIKIDLSKNYLTSHYRTLSIMLNNQLNKISMMSSKRRDPENRTKYIFSNRNQDLSEGLRGHLQITQSQFHKNKTITIILEKQELSLHHL